MSTSSKRFNGLVISATLPKRFTDRFGIEQATLSFKDSWYTKMYGITVIRHHDCIVVTGPQDAIKHLVKLLMMADESLVKW